MGKIFSLRTRIICIFAAIGLVAFAGCFGVVWYSFTSDALYSSMVAKEMLLYRLAKDMEISLANQKGLLTYYLIDGDAKWLEELGRYRQLFQQGLESASQLELTSSQSSIIDHIAEEYHAYTVTKDQAIENYRQKKSLPLRSISVLHERQRDAFFDVLSRCRSFSGQQWESIEISRQWHVKMSSRLRLIMAATLLAFLLLCIFFLFILYRQILLPIRNLALQTGQSPQDSSQDEVVSLSRSLKTMMKDMSTTSGELERSRKHLAQAERMAMVGELAAGVAHTIRNPFTSIKMRMFSLSRSLDLTSTQNEDLSVITDEIGRIDRIVENFLEFAKLPRLSLQECNLGELIDSVIVLLRHRLEEYDTEVHYLPGADMPRIQVDADRIKEALVNLITNSCQAIGGSVERRDGCVEITEMWGEDLHMGKTVSVSVRDNGPGIAEDILHKVTSPFFTTKEEGSGLGLSIVNRIVKEHKGQMSIRSEVGRFCEIVITLPVMGNRGT